MVVSSRQLGRAVAAIAAAACVATGCTFTGLGNYDVETCTRPRGTSTTVQRVGMVGDLTVASASGKNVIGAFAATVTGGACIEAVGPNGFLNSSCSFLADETNLVPRQPMVIPIKGGYAAALIATTAPCTAGALTYRFSAPGIAGKVGVPCDMAGAALPSVAALSDDTAVVTWYRTGFDSRSDPINTCAGATAIGLELAIVTGASTGAPVVGATINLSDASTSVRPAALAPIPGQPQALVAAPHLDGVGVWTVGASTPPGQPVTIPSLARARAAAVAIASDGSGRIAVVAEIGCSPQTIALAVGTLADGFPNTTVVAPAGSGLAVAPSVAWIEGQDRWVVAWISSDGGGHVLARSFDPKGNALGATVDPGMKATAASVTSTGDVFGFVASSSSFVTTSLGCTP